MARGWESKSVEEQQAEAGERSKSPRRRMSAAEAATFREKESLRLQRQRVMQQIEVSASERHRAQLQQALSELEDRLRKLEE
jgi:hypothetical protein